jgi:hypothetical protein
MKKKNILIGTALTLSLIYLGIFLNYGLITTSDSQGYLLSVLGLTVKKQIMLSPVWPFGYPFFISICTFLGFFPTQGAAVINSLALAGIFVYVALIANKQSRNVYLSAFLLIFCFTWHELFYISRVIWSETMYTSLTCIHFYFLYRHLESGKKQDFVYAAITAGLPLLTRYIGYSLIGVFGLYILFYLFHKERKINVKEMIEYLGILAISNMFHFLWLNRNYNFQKTLHGKRRPSKISFQENVSDLVDTLIQQLTHTPMLWLVLLSSFVYFLHSLWKKKKWTPSSLFMLYVYSYIGLYIGLLLYSTSTANLDKISPRFTTPILVPLLLSIPYLWNSISQKTFFEFAPKIKGGHFLVGILTVSWLGGLYASQDVIDDYILEVKPSKHSVSYGFESSETAQQIHEILGEHLKDRDNIVIVSIIKTRQSGQGFVFMTRKTTWDGPSFSFRKYVDFSPTSIIVEVHKDNQKKEVEHWLYEPLQSVKDVERMLSKIHSRTKSQDVLIFAESKYLSKLGIDRGNLEKVKMDFYSCRKNKTQAKPFYVYLCESTVKDSKYEDVQNLSQHDLLISEMMVRPLIANHRGQWFELYNHSDKDVNLQGLIVSNGKQEMVVDIPVIVSSKAYVVFALRSSPKINGGMESVGFEYTLGKLKFRNGGKLEIRNTKGTLDSVVYRLGLDGLSDGKGVSIYRNIEDVLQSKKVKWCESKIEYGPGGKGTPGIANEQCETVLE